MRRFFVVVIALLLVTCLSSTVEAGLFNGGCLSKLRARRACAKQAACAQPVCEQVAPVQTGCNRPLLNAAVVPLKIVKGAVVVTKEIVTAPARAVQNVRATRCANGACARVVVE